MLAGISITVTTSTQLRLETVIRDGNSPQKHAWRTAIVLLSANGVGTNEIMRRTGKSKTCVWRWQERFMREGVNGLLRDKTRPSRIPPLGPDVAERVLAARRRGLTSSMARVPPMHYGDKSNPLPQEGSRLDAKRGSRLEVI